MAEGQKHLLIVDDETALREAIAERLADQGFMVEQADRGEVALQRLTEFAFDIIITDLRLPDIDGRQVLDAALERYPDIIAIVITGYGTVKDAVEAIKQGASDFITKPFQFDALLHVLNSALEQLRLRSENAYLRSQLEQRYRIDGLVGTSRVMRDLFHLLETVSTTSSTVLITGETGTGKELAARAIHHTSPRRSNRFVAINCSAIPETLLEAELFGHVRGAFTGAVGTRQGRLEQAHKGTLFLDEVGTMSPALQAKLLRVLQEREFERVGDSHTVKIDVRVIAATHSDLAKMVGDGSFREDLYYRLNVIPIKVPSLRERRDDIPLLAQHFLQKLASDLGTAADDGVSGRDAPADGVSLARQRPSARERRRTGGRVQSGPIADRRPGSRDRDSAAGRSGATGGNLVSRGRARFRELHREPGARAHQAIARADSRQQTSGCEAPEPQTHHPHRETETARAAVRRRQRSRCRQSFKPGRRLIMPPRHAYWTIILEGKPTAFRAHTRDELVPTFKQLQTRHPDVVLMWFARGRLWPSQDDERQVTAAKQQAEKVRRGAEWRPGGAHRDPRDRFKVSRDEKRRRFAANLRRDRTEGQPRWPRAVTRDPTDRLVTADRHVTTGHRVTGGLRMTAGRHAKAGHRVRTDRSKDGRHATTGRRVTAGLRVTAGRREKAGHRVRTDRSMADRRVTTGRHVRVDLHPRSDRSKDGLHATTGRADPAIDGHPPSAIGHRVTGRVVHDHTARKARGGIGRPSPGGGRPPSAQGDRTRGPRPSDRPRRNGIARREPPTRGTSRSPQPAGRRRSGGGSR